MSAADFAARGLALAAVADRPRLFAHYTGAHLPAAALRIDTAGHAEIGLGAASYVSDTLATPALAAAHPAACVVTAGGRVFRLAGSAERTVTPEMLGCPAHSPGTNQQPFVQAAVDYAQAVGLAGVHFPQPVYELWAPPRTGYPAHNGYDNATHTGEFIVVSAPLRLTGGSGRRTTLHCKGPNGGSLLDDYQVVNVDPFGGPCIWRGAAIKVTGTVPAWEPRPADGELSHLTVRDLIFRSDAIGVKNPNWPALPPSREPGRVNCWDVSNKGIYCQQDVHSGDVRLENVEIRGFLGECFYMSFASQDQGWTGARYTVRNCVFRDSNGQGLNPCGPMSLDVDGLLVENCAFGWEGVGGNDYSRIVNAYFRDCLNAGVAGSGTTTTGFYATPLRADGSQPVCLIDITCEDCGEFFLGSYVHGRLKLIDTSLALVASNNQTIKNNVVDVTLQVHAKDLTNAVRFNGADAPGTQLVANNTVRLAIVRTKEAVAAGRKVVYLCGQANSLGRDNYLYVRGYAATNGSVTSVSDNYVAIVDEGLDTSGGFFGAGFDPGTTTYPDMGSGWVRPDTFTGGASYHSIGLPAQGMYQHGAEIVVAHRDAGNTARVVGIREGGAERAIVGFKDTAKFRLDAYKGRWELVGPIPRRSATAPVDIAPTPLGGESGPYAVAAPGCRPWHRTALDPADGGALPAGFAISVVRAGTDEVRFWVRNIDGAGAADPGNISLTARWWAEPS